MSIEITEQQVDGVTVFRLTGRLTLGEAVSGLVEKTKSYLAGGEKSLLFNMQGLSYLDSAGLGALVKCFNLAKAQGAKLKLLLVPKTIRELMRITNLLTYFEIFDDETTAISSFRGSLTLGGQKSDEIS